VALEITCASRSRAWKRWNIEMCFLFDCVHTKHGFKEGRIQKNPREIQWYKYEREKPKGIYVR
jgi:hypothetical protein